MRKLLLLLVLTVMASPVMASKARLTALGQNANGSLYIEDNRNIFLNPAKIMAVDPHLNFEMGGTTATSTPKAEGGFVMKHNDHRVAVQLGRPGNAVANINAASNLLPITFLVPQNSFEIIFGRDKGDRPMGFSIFYANSKTDTGATANRPDDTASELTLKFGTTLKSGLDLYGYYDVQQKAQHDDTNTANDYDYTQSGANLGLGATKRVKSDTIASVALVLKQGDIEAVASSTKTVVDEKSIYLNATKELKKTETSLVFVTVGLQFTDGGIDQAGAGTDYDLKTTAFPVVIGAEAKATDWMDLRASVSQTILLDNRETINGTNEYKTDNVNTTTVGAGVSVKWEDFTLDGTLTGMTTGVISSASLISNASLTYSF